MEKQFILLTKMAEYLDEVMPANRFDPETWTNGEEDLENLCPMLKSECGTVGCIAGWVMTADWMKDYAIQETWFGKKKIDYTGSIAVALGNCGYFDIDQDVVVENYVEDLDTIVTLQAFDTEGMTKAYAVQFLKDMDKLFNGDIDVVTLGHNTDIQITLEN